jgi:ABC-2 type transport system ATP-binding protein
VSASVEFLEVRKRYGAQAVLRGVSFSVQRGEIVGLLGPNGCGKTTTLRLIAGFLSPDDGEVRVCGENVGDGSLAARRRIGYLPEKPPLYDALRVVDYLDFVAAAKGLSGTERQRGVERALSDYALTAVSRKVIGTLSKGYRQRVGLAQATLAEPEVLLLDEATNGLDALQMVEARALIRAGSQGRAVIFCSHLMQEVAALCDRVLVLHEGRTVELGEASPTPRFALRLAGLSAGDARQLVGDVPGISEVDCRADGDSVLCRCTASTPEVADTLARAVIARARLLSLEVQRASLEDRFIAAMQREGRLSAAGIAATATAGALAGAAR